MRKPRSPIRGGNIMPPVRLLPKFRLVRLVVRAERVTVRARNELDALTRVEVSGGWKWWPAHGSDGDLIGETTCERVLAHRKRNETEETMLAKPQTKGGDHD